uniref:Uncharacterized protein n=1 Tax=viral metagenome TaxID=1070528 RepID=A0A6C0C721_9ZZZZ
MQEIADSWIKIDKTYYPSNKKTLDKIEFFHNLFMDVNTYKTRKNKSVILNFDVDVPSFITATNFKFLQKIIRSLDVENAPKIKISRRYQIDLILFINYFATNTECKSLINGIARVYGETYIQLVNHPNIDWKTFFDDSIHSSILKKINIEKIIDVEPIFKYYGMEYGIKNDEIDLSNFVVYCDEDKYLYKLKVLDHTNYWCLYKKFDKYGDMKITINSNESHVIIEHGGSFLNFLLNQRKVDTIPTMKIITTSGKIVWTINTLTLQVLIGRSIESFSERRLTNNT